MGRRITPQYVMEDRGFATPCWIWQVTMHPRGYGRKKVAGKNVWAHRFYYEQHRGPIAPGLQIDHLCRVRACVNPDHLEPVTPAENTRRGRVAKLDVARATEIRELARQRWIQQDIADAYGVRQSTVSLIARDRMWVLT